tara:strand:+ start:6840 stop:7133 length:294 start_codon:yes stop_codon:yes gene_type:complete
LYINYCSIENIAVMIDSISMKFKHVIYVKHNFKEYVEDLIISKPPCFKASLYDFVGTSAQTFGFYLTGTILKVLFFMFAVCSLYIEARPILYSGGQQ